MVLLLFGLVYFFVIAVEAALLMAGLMWAFLVALVGVRGALMIIAIGALAAAVFD